MDVNNFKVHVLWTYNGISSITSTVFLDPIKDFDNPNSSDTIKNCTTRIETQCFHICNTQTIGLTETFSECSWG